MYKIRLDSAGEQTSLDGRRFISKNGVQLELTHSFTSQSNSASRRLIQQLWKTTRTILLELKLHKELWAEAISHLN